MKQRPPPRWENNIGLLILLVAVAFIALFLAMPLWQGPRPDAVHGWQCASGQPANYTSAACP